MSELKRPSSCIVTLDNSLWPRVTSGNGKISKKLKKNLEFAKQQIFSKMYSTKRHEVESCTSFANHKITVLKDTKEDQHKNFSTISSFSEDNEKSSIKKNQPKLSPKDSSVHLNQSTVCYKNSSTKLNESKHECGCCPGRYPQSMFTADVDIGEDTDEECRRFAYKSAIVSVIVCMFLILLFYVLILVFNRDLLHDR